MCAMMEKFRILAGGELPGDILSGEAACKASRSSLSRLFEDLCDGNTSGENADPLLFRRSLAVAAKSSNPPVTPLTLKQLLEELLS
jgi:hypothetical protein